MSSLSRLGTLADSTIEADLTSFSADGWLSYTDILQLLNDVKVRGSVTSTEFLDLRTVAGTSDYVSRVFGNLVNGCQANYYWTAGAAQLHHRHGNKDFTETDLVRAAKAFPVKVRAIASSEQRLDTTPLPAIAVMADGTFLVVGRAVPAVDDAGAQ